MQGTQEMLVWSLGWEDHLEEEMATHSSVLAWRTTWTKSLVGYSPWGHSELDTTETMQHAQARAHTHVYTQNMEGRTNKVNMHLKRHWRTFFENKSAKYYKTYLLKKDSYVSEKKKTYDIWYLFKGISEFNIKGNKQSIS